MTKMRAAASHPVGVFDKKIARCMSRAGMWDNLRTVGIVAAGSIIGGQIAKGVILGIAVTTPPALIATAIMLTIPASMYAVGHMRRNAALNRASRLETEQKRTFGPGPSFSKT